MTYNIYYIDVLIPASGHKAITKKNETVIDCIFRCRIKKSLANDSWKKNYIKAWEYLDLCEKQIKSDGSKVYKIFLSKHPSDMTMRLYLMVIPLCKYLLTAAGEMKKSKSSISNTSCRIILVEFMVQQKCWFCLRSIFLNSLWQKNIVHITGKIVDPFSDKWLMWKYI